MVRMCFMMGRVVIIIFSWLGGLWQILLTSMKRGGREEWLGIWSCSWDLGSSCLYQGFSVECSSSPVTIPLSGSFPPPVLAAGVRGTMVAMVMLVILSDQVGRRWVTKS